MSNPSDRVLGTPPTNTSKIQPPVLDNLAMAVPPKWGAAVLRLRRSDPKSQT
jgi:hypothetical protein